MENNKSEYILKIEGMDCVEEISTLKRVLSPIVGGEEYLFFDLLNARLVIKKSQESLNKVEIIKAIEKTGMRAILWGLPKEEISFYKKNAKLIFTFISIISLLVALFIHWYLHRGFQLPVFSIMFYIISIITGGWFVFPKAFYSLKKLHPDINLLMSVAVLGAAFIGEWLEAATVTVLFAISFLLESWSVERARRATKSLLDLAPNNARLLKENGSEELVLASTVKVGEFFIIRPGERVPLDGVVMKGVSEINQAPITGESLPVHKKKDDMVFAGTINGDGALEIKCTKTSEHSTLTNIIRLVSEAHVQRAPSEQWVEKFAKIYTPIVMGMAFFVLIIPPLFFSGDWNEWLYRSLVLLVIACPCALVISTPVSIVAALTSAARNGVLIKGGKFVELPSHLKVIAFDKTGTITKGELSVAKIVPFNEHSEYDLLEIASAIEIRSEHPIARAIVLHAKSKGISVVAAENYVTVQGKGATAIIKNQNYWLGSHRFLEEKKQENPSIHQQLTELMKSGHTVVVVGNNIHVCGFIALSDAIRPEAPEVISKIHDLGIKHLVMLTGDNHGTAELISSKVGMDGFYAELLPQDKVQKIEDLVQEYGSVAMIGDGVNDAPALARSTLGIAMGMAGSDAAIETADVTLMTDDLNKIPWLISHSKRTVVIIRQNIIFSLFVKLIFMVLTFTGHSSLWAAISADMGASLLVIFNGLRLLSQKKM